MTMPRSCSLLGRRVSTLCRTVDVVADGPQILLAENWNESNTLLGSIGPHYFIHYKGWKQTYVAFSRPEYYLFNRFRPLSRP